MLRTLVLLLLLANLGYFAWTRNGLAWAGLPHPVPVAATPHAPAGEPLSPEKIQFIRGATAPDASTPVPDAGVSL